MLGWAIDIWRQIDPPSTPARKRRGFIAGWETALEGIKWLDRLVAKGKAVGLGGNGYPLTYKAPMSVIASQLAKGPPRHPGPLTIGEDYFLPSGWTRDFELDEFELAQCSPDEESLIEAWDLS
jgi:hypothetical protein